MIEFWIAAAAMIGVALMIALPPFLRPPRLPTDDSRRENIAAARASLRELQNRDLPKKESEEYEAEIKSRLLQDAGESDSAGGKKMRAFAADKTGALLIFLFLFFGAPLLYFHLGAPRAMSASPMPNLGAAIAGLQQHIAENPDDADALSLMGRTLTAIGREKEAAEYFARALAAAAAESSDDKK